MLRSAGSAAVYDVPLTVATSRELYHPSNQYTLYPVTPTSSVDAAQLSPTEPGDSAVTVSPAGARGGVVSAPLSESGVTTVTASDDSDRCPAVSYAATRNVYCVAGRMASVILTVVTSPARVSR